MGLAIAKRGRGSNAVIIPDSIAEEDDGIEEEVLMSWDEEGPGEANSAEETTRNTELSQISAQLEQKHNEGNKRKRGRPVIKLRTDSIENERSIRHQIKEHKLNNNLREILGLPIEKDAYSFCISNPGKN